MRPAAHYRLPASIGERGVGHALFRDRSSANQAILGLEEHRHTLGT